MEQAIHKVPLATSQPLLFHLLTTGTYLGLGMGREDLDVSILYDTKLGPQAKVPLMPLLNFIHYD